MAVAISRRRSPTIVMTLVAMVSMSGSIAYGAELENDLGGPAGYGTHRLAPFVRSSCDMIAGFGTPGPVDLRPAFASGLNFFGVPHNDVCINANGTLSFGAPIDIGTSPGIPRPGPAVIAPWWADVDIREHIVGDPAANAVYWDVRPRQITVTWHDVGYDSLHHDLVNDFQVIVRTRGCFDTVEWEFRYHRCEWTAPDSSGGTNGRCGAAAGCTAAVAGFDAGDQIHFDALPGSGTDSIADLCTSSNVGEPGVWRYTVVDHGPCWNGRGAMCNTGLQGACSDGIVGCDDTRTARCNAILAPTPERCDNVDNDCNGRTDEGTDLCPIGEVCAGGTCVPRCADGHCPGGEACAPDQGCVTSDCIPRCGAGQHCDGYECLSVCAGVRCPAPSTCVDGICADLCAHHTCPQLQACQSGQCVDRCDCAGCPSGEVCRSDGLCEPAGCADLHCAPGELCVADGATLGCVDPCVGAVCPGDQQCEQGRCRDMVSHDGGGIGDASDGASVGFDGGADANDGGRSAPRSGCTCTAVNGRCGDRESVFIGALLIIGAMAARRSRYRRTQR